MRSRPRWLRSKRPNAASSTERCPAELGSERAADLGIRAGQGNDAQRAELTRLRRAAPCSRPCFRVQCAAMNERRADRYSAWGLTWLAYASYYFGRKGFSVVKSTLHHTLGLSEGTLGAIDTLYL